MSRIRSTRPWVYLTVSTGIALMVLQAYTPYPALAQSSGYRLIENWAQLPDDFTWGQLIAVEVDAEGNLIAFQRCSSNTCVDQSAPPLLKFSPSGLTSFRSATASRYLSMCANTHQLRR